MKTILKPLLVTAICAFPLMISAQVTIGSGKPPNIWALLDLDTNPGEDSGVKRGLHLPRLTSEQRDLLVNNTSDDADKNLAQGLFIYNITTQCLEFWNTTKWVSLCKCDDSDGTFDGHENPCDAIITAHYPPGMVVNILSEVNPNLSVEVASSNMLSYWWWRSTSADMSNAVEIGTGTGISPELEGVTDMEAGETYYFWVEIYETCDDDIVLFSEIFTVNVIQPELPIVPTCQSGYYNIPALPATGVGTGDGRGVGFVDITVTAPADVFVPRFLCGTKGFDPEETHDLLRTGNPPMNVAGQLTMRFMTFNLGANPFLTPKEQMAFVSELEAENMACADITVLGGLHQWGRKDILHAHRCHPMQNPELFTSVQYSLQNYDPKTDTQFVRQASWASDWETYSLTHTWGNGITIHGSNDQTPIKGKNDPCPAGWRIPTQHEWALLGNENGNSNEVQADDFSISASGTATASGITWVPVLRGKANYWDYNNYSAGGGVGWDFWGNKEGIAGFALYYTTEWNNADAGFKDGTLLLTTEEAPEPLMFLPAGGYRDPSSGTFLESGMVGLYATSVKWAGYTTYRMQFGNGGRNVFFHNQENGRGFSVRCIAEEVIKP